MALWAGLRPSLRFVLPYTVPGLRPYAEWVPDVELPWPFLLLGHWVPPRLRGTLSTVSADWTASRQALPLVYNVGSAVAGGLPMVSAHEHQRLTPQDYFEWEAQQQLRYEYFDGKVFAMAGGSLAHADIALNIASLLKAQVNPC